MKTKLILLFITIITAITSCKKDEDNQNFRLTREDYLSGYQEYSGMYPYTFDYHFVIQAVSGSDTKVTIDGLGGLSEYFTGSVENGVLIITEKTQYVQTTSQYSITVSGTGNLSGDTLTINTDWERINNSTGNVEDFGKNTIIGIKD
ncbi:MAG: hypothetical protein AB7P01_05210 [Bacteroidia bacterium]